MKCRFHLGFNENSPCMLEMQGSDVFPLLDVDQFKITPVPIIEDQISRHQFAGFSHIDRPGIGSKQKTETLTVFKS